MKYPRIWIAAHGGPGNVISLSVIPADVLRVLGRHESPDYREEVALRLHTPLDVLELLSRDSVWRVRYAVARHPRTPREVRQWLAKDKIKRVQGMAALWLQGTASNYRERLAAVANRKFYLYEGLLEYLAAEDRSKIVRAAAKKELERRGEESWTKATSARAREALETKELDKRERES